MLYFSEYDIRMFVFVFWLGNRPSREMMEGTWGARGGGGGGHPKMFTGVYNVYRCVQGDKGVTPHVHVRTYTISFYVFVSWCLV